MATNAHSTTAPARPLLRAAGPCAVLTSDEVVALTARSRDARGRFVKSVTVTGFAAEIDRQEGFPRSGDAPELPTPPLLSSDTLDAVRADLDALLTLHDEAPRGGDIATPSEPVSRCHMATTERDMASAAHAPDLGDEHQAAAARAIHLRRALEAAADHAAALLPALGLPRLVTGAFIQVDPAAAGDALDLAIATLDALDADPDIEDGADDEATGDDELSLGWTNDPRQTHLGHGSDDGEPILGAPERHPYFACIGEPYYEPANGSFRRFRNWHSQVSWAQGSRQDGEGESEPGYDLACDDDELDGAGDVDAEPSIGWPEDFLARLDPRLALESQADREADDADLEPDGERMIVRRPLGLCEPPVRDLVARAKAIRSGISLPGEVFHRPWLDADRVFGLHVEGDCCAPEILSHGAVHVDKDAKPEPGDFVAFWFEATRAGRPVLIGWVKRLVMGLPDGLRFPFRAAPGAELLPVLMVESLNPPRCYTIDVRRVHALFEVVAVIPPAEAIASRRHMAAARP